MTGIHDIIDKVWMGLLLDKRTVHWILHRVKEDKQSSVNSSFKSHKYAKESPIISFKLYIVYNNISWSIRTLNIIK